MPTRETPPRQPTHAVVDETKPESLVVEVTNQGRGGKQHKETQAVIRRVAENYGFPVEIEKRLADGGGDVDVSLKKGDVRIACEVSITSSVDYETKNVRKCLNAGYDYTIVLVANHKKIPVLKERLRSEIPPEQLDE